MEISRNGFIQPVLDSNSCVNCGKCKSVCPVYRIPEKHYPRAAYGLVLNDEAIIRNSSSGGAFMLFAMHWINNGGSVFGCKYDEHFLPVIDEASRIEQLFEMQGSKYVQANANSVYERIKTKLDYGESVLFCSTPCQVSALKNYLGREYSELLLIDIFCEGTPGQGLWRDYLKYLREKHNGKITQVVFRDGSSWRDFFPSPQGYYVIDNEKIPFGTNRDPYFNSFLRHVTYGRVCYSCPYATEMRVGDISIGDFWGISKVAPNLADKYGNSAVLINTAKGEMAFENASAGARYWTARLDDIKSNNYVLSRPSELPKERDGVINCYQTMPFSKFVKRCLGKKTRISRVVIRKVINILKSLISD